MRDELAMSAHAGCCRRFEFSHRGHANAVESHSESEGGCAQKLHWVAATNAKSGRLYANRRRMGGARATLEQHIALRERGEDAGKKTI